MTRFEYIDALKQALAGLPPEEIAATVAEYERRISDASAAGQGEDAIIESLGDPQDVAAGRRAALESKVLKQDKGPARFVRKFFSLIGLTVFNLFLVIPAIVYSALLFASFMIALACYGGGIVTTAASLAGVSEISLDQPSDTVVFKQTPVEKANAPAASASASANQITTAESNAFQLKDGNSIVKVGPDGIRISEDGDNLEIAEGKRGTNIDMPGLHIRSPQHSRSIFFGSDDVSDSRPAQASIGICLILAGILAFLLCLTIGKYTMIGILRLAQMELSVLKSARSP